MPYFTRRNSNRGVFTHIWSKCDLEVPVQFFTSRRRSPASGGLSTLSTTMPRKSRCPVLLRHYDEIACYSCARCSTLLLDPPHKARTIAVLVLGAVFGCSESASFDAIVEDLESGRYEESLTKIQSAELLPTDRYLLLAAVGRSSFQAENYGVSIVAFEAAFDVTTEVLNDHPFLADAYVEVGDIDKALALLEDSHGIIGPPEFASPEEVTSLINRGGEIEITKRYASLLIELGRPSEAKGVLRDGLLRNPADADMLETYVRLLRDDGDEKTATRFLLALCEYVSAQPPLACTR